MEETLQGPVAPATDDQATASAAADRLSKAASDFAKSVVASGASPDGVQVLKAQITAVDSVSAQPTCSVYLQGDTSTAIPGIAFYDHYSPVVGDTVQVLKVNAQIVILGQLNDSGAGTQNGWLTPGLASNVSQTSDPLQYRVVYDNGDRKVQMRGQVSIASGATLLYTMPTTARPDVKKTIIVGRDLSGGTVGILLAINTNGQMVLEGGTTGVKGYSGGATGLQTGVEGGDAVTTDVFGSSNGFNGGRAATSGSTVSMDHNLTTNEQQNAHQHLFQHTHKGGDHQHPLQVVTAATNVHFNGVEYYL